MSDGYTRKRQFYGDWSGSLPVTAFVGQSTLVACKPSYAIHVQRVYAPVTGAVGGVTWSFKDSTGAVTIATESAATVTVDAASVTYDFGQDGITLPTGADFVFVPSQTGAAGAVTWDAFQKLAT